MYVSISGLLGRVADFLEQHGEDTGRAFQVRKLSEHLIGTRRRWLGGDLQVVDEFFALYVDEDQSYEVQSVSAAARDVLTERRRQVEAEGYSLEHDDEHGDGSLVDAAVMYARYADAPQFAALHPMGWPWSAESWRPGSRRRGLVKAGALILAEIERLDRLEARCSS